MKRTGIVLTVVGAIGAVVLVWPKGPPAEVDARFGRCPSVVVACDVLEGSSYHRRALDAWDCHGDGGPGFVLKAKHRPVLVEGSCSLTTLSTGVELEPPCACRKAHGTCTRMVDGGVEVARPGVTLPPGFVGDGCQPKVCVELFGVTSWPPNCPGG